MDALGQPRRKWAIVVLAAGLVAAGVSAWLLYRGEVRVTGATAEERIACIARLAQHQPLGAARALAGACNDQEAVRRAALCALARFASPEVRPAVEAGLKDPDAGVRSAAAAALAAFDDAAAADTLVGFITAESDPQVRQDAINALGRMHAPRALVFLVQTVEEGRDGDLQAWAARLLRSLLCLNAPMPERGDTAGWQVFVETAKLAPQVAPAFSAVSAPLVRHPEVLKPPPPKH
jgi:hypothetical protein